MAKSRTIYCEEMRIGDVFVTVGRPARRPITTEERLDLEAFVHRKLTALDAELKASRGVKISIDPKAEPASR